MAALDTQQEAIQSRLFAVLRRPENEQCADCEAATPKWATVTHGGFICTQCAGVHRSLGVHLSFVLSVMLDKWTDDQAKIMDKGGNTKLNQHLERTLALQLQLNVQSVKKPKALTQRSDRELFIRAKDEAKMFSGGVGAPFHANLTRMALSNILCNCYFHLGPTAESRT